MAWQAHHFESTAPIGFVETHQEYQEKKETPAEKRQKRIAEAAYYIAEKRGFQGDMMLDDWLQAEAKENSRFLTMDWVI